MLPLAVVLLFSRPRHWVRRHKRIAVALGLAYLALDWLGAALDCGERGVADVGDGAEMIGPCVSVIPGVMSGQPCLHGHRLTAEQIAVLYERYGIEEIFHGWPYLTRADVLVCCYYMARYGSRRWQKRWGRWWQEQHGALWLSEFDKAELPPRE